MKHTTAYPTAKVREATEQEVVAFCQHKLNVIDSLGGGLYLYSVEDLSMQEFPTLTVFDHFFRPGSQYDGRLLIASYQLKGSGCIQRHYGWDKTTKKLMPLTEEEYERHAGI